MKTAYIGIGSNLGDPHRNCLEAVDRIGMRPDCRILGLSGLYETEPVGVEGQGWYINCVASLSTGLSARDLMKDLLLIEAGMGRVRRGLWEPRVIDLDLLLFGTDIIDDEELKVPHPLMHKRRFVMAPMNDLAPDLIHPVIGRTMAELFEEIPVDGQSVRPVKDR